MHAEYARYIGRDRLDEFTLPRLILYLEYRFGFTLEKLVEKGFLPESEARNIVAWENNHIENKEIGSTVLSYALAIGHFVRSNIQGLPPSQKFEQNLERHLHKSLENTVQRRNKITHSQI